MRTLLIGKDGQLGRALHAALINACDLVAFGKDALDVTDDRAIREAICTVRPNLVINAAAYTAVDSAELNPNLAMEINCLGPGRMAAEAARAGAALIHYSTDYVFNGRRKTPYSEETAPNPINFYGRSKLAGDYAVQASGAAHIIFRTSWVFSMYGKNFVRSMLRLGAERSSLSIVDDQFGRPTSAAVLADLTTSIIEQSNGQPATFFRHKGGIVNASCSGTATWFSFAQEIFHIARELGIKLAIKELCPMSASDYNYTAPRPQQTRLSLDRMRKNFGLTPPHWRKALRDTLIQINNDHL